MAFVYNKPMKPVKIIGGLFVLAVLAFAVKVFVLVPDEFKAGAQAVASCPGGAFDKSAVVFDAITICATKGVSRKKVAHAARVAAQWLDNDEDAVPDNPLVNGQLRENKATLVMSREGFGRYIVKVDAALKNSGRFGQDLHAVETDPGDGRRDASQEEIHHLIMGAGWMRVYPEIFSDEDASSLAYQAWQKADKRKYYVYNDPTCTDTCKVMEFIYKSTAAYLGSDADLAETEFTIKNRTDLRARLPEIVALYESSNYVYPRLQWPDGNYAHTQHIFYQP